MCVHAAMCMHVCMFFFVLCTKEDKNWLLCFLSQKMCLFQFFFGFKLRQQTVQETRLIKMID